jgi:hypothetical protein
MLSTVIFVPYYNWQYAKDHGFVSWLLFGQIAPTAKALVWPYFVFFADRSANTSKGDGSLTEYSDNKYNFAFQFPSDWKLQKLPEPNEAGETRVLVQSSWKSSYVSASVGQIGRSITQAQFDANPNSDWWTARPGGVLSVSGGTGGRSPEAMSWRILARSTSWSM